MKIIRHRRIATAMALLGVVAVSAFGQAIPQAAQAQAQAQPQPSLSAPHEHDAYVTEVGMMRVALVGVGGNFVIVLTFFFWAGRKYQVLERLHERVGEHSITHTRLDGRHDAAAKRQDKADDRQDDADRRMDKFEVSLRHIDASLKELLEQAKEKSDLGEKLEEIFRILKGRE